MFDKNLHIFTYPLSNLSLSHKLKIGIFPQKWSTKIKSVTSHKTTKIWQMARVKLDDRAKSANNS